MTSVLIRRETWAEMYKKEYSMRHQVKLAIFRERREAFWKEPKLPTSQTSSLQALVRQILMVWETQLLVLCYTGPRKLIRD